MSLLEERIHRDNPTNVRQECTTASHSRVIGGLGDGLGPRTLIDWRRGSHISI